MTWPNCLQWEQEEGNQGYSTLTAKDFPLVLKSSICDGKDFVRSTATFTCATQTLVKGNIFEMSPDGNVHQGRSVSCRVFRPSHNMEQCSINMPDAFLENFLSDKIIGNPYKHFLLQREKMDFNLLTLSPHMIEDALDKTDWRSSTTKVHNNELFVESCSSLEDFIRNQEPWYH
ncbi:hypothetical protein EUTSA_v10026233mg [Eutrema salsugineum]|uniref:Uncharacterized protein n=1 Tax=Eutrema salsugineum TaxID=72664 RepID=V4MSV5_EUTSA|nr:hypothetical protein EUTSA_v10026233mg [Eutrema salsugineum]